MTTTPNQTSERATPPFTYFGGKTSIADRIVDALPPHRHYVEPFAGSLAVLLAKPRAHFETVNDLDEHLVTFWRVLRDRGDELAYACSLTPHARHEHRDSYDLDVEDELELARRIWVRLSQGRGNTFRRTGSMSWTLNAYADRMFAAAERLAGVSLECRPALQLIDDYGQHPNVLLYVDPPYLGSVRAGGNEYRHEMRDEESHRELAAALLGCQAAVVLSHYPASLYDELYAGWHRVDVPAYTGNGGINGRNGGRTEVLWINRAPAAHLFSEATA